MNEEMSKDLYERAVKHMPGGVNSPVRAYKAVDRVPRFIASAKGDRITDVDGNEYIDFFDGAGALNYGHNPDYIKEKLIDYLQSDGTMATNTWIGNYYVGSDGCWR